MKVLLLGEFSSLHRYLKDGLQELGDIEVKLFANGDSWKKIGGADGSLFNYYGGIPGRIKTYNEALKNARAFEGYDVVQLMNPQIYPHIVSDRITKMLADSNKCFSLVAAGDDLALVTAYREGKLDYYMLDYEKAPLALYDPESFKGRKKIALEKKIVSRSDVVIPSLYEYTLGYEGNERLSGVIPFPINTDNIKFGENTVKDKLVFFHGLNKELAKGTPFIREALLRLQDKYPNDVEVIIDGHMPFDKYVEVMNRANVVVDQCCSHGYGINACIAMAQGKVVMAGSRDHTLAAFGIESSPIIHVEPSVDQIYGQLEYILENRNNVTQWGYDSRRYVEDMHHYVKVAARYVEAWKATGKI